MKAMLLQLILPIIIFSCINRDSPVNKDNLTYGDYRLFQGTPAWDLAKAVQDQDEKKIKNIVSGTPKLVNYQESKYGNTLLMLTIINQQFKSFENLVYSNADVNIHNTYDGTSAIIFACSSKDIDSNFAKILLQNGANVNDIEIGKRRQGNSTRFTPLIIAAKKGNLNLVAFLVKKGANVNFQNEFDQSALSECVMQKRYNVALCLLKVGADYKSPIFYRPDYSIPSQLQDPNEKGKPMYIVDVLREDFFEFDTNEYKYKMQIVDFLKSKGINYRESPIPNFIIKKAKQQYPNEWKEYLEKY